MHDKAMLNGTDPDKTQYLMFIGPCIIVIVEE